MANTATVTARVPREIKRQAEKVLKQQGMTPTEAINRLYMAVAKQKEFPVEALPDPHAFPEPGERRLDLNKMENAQLETWEALKRLAKIRVEDWGEDFDKPYKQIIEEGRRRDYEALS
ncbi:MAG: type II toxin-antitoxin system RelB/DinJ family antitoxin [Coriobacteriia bacterium]|nr:type II toxin-antitoxin system RelB/DinJ family antitoxin [Coriobacteriia bacterium]